MFQRFEFLGYCSGLAVERRFKYELIDDEFGTINGITTAPRYSTPIGFAAGTIIDIYREKGLNLEGNVALFLLQFDLYKVDDLIKSCRKYFTQWRYIDEKKLKKYIVFS